MEFLLGLNNHMDANPLYPGDWFKSFIDYSNDYSNKNGHYFNNIDEMVLCIGSIFRETDDKWCRENINGYSHSEDNKNNSLSKSQTIYDEEKETPEFWYRFVGQMLIHRYG